MKFRTLSLIAAMTFLAALTIPVRLTAQEQQAEKRDHRRYTVTDLGTLGGTFSQAFGINNDGSVVGFATLTGDTALHAFRWRKGVMTNLSTLAPADTLPYSVAFSINNNDEIVGYSETSVPDPLGENFCGDSLICLPVIWRGGVISALPTLGGNNGQASAINNRGQVVGVAETDKTDPTCQNPVVKPAIWEKGQIRALPTAPFRDGIVGGGPGPAGNNDQGQVVGNVETCNFSGARAYLWENNKVINMGALEGLVLAPVAINNKGQATGTAFDPATNINHGFLWQDGVASDLGSLPGDPQVHGNAINDRGQITGQTCDVTESTCTVFLWQKGVMTDLNSVVPADTSLDIVDPSGINSRGEIVGLAIEKATGQLHAFLAIPCDEEHADKEGCEDAGHDLNATQSRPAAITSPAPTATHPNLTHRGMATGSRAVLARGYRSPVVAAPKAPFNETASAQNTYQIKLNWQEASGQKQSGFNIYRCHGCSNPRTQGTKITAVGASVFTYTDGSSSKPLTESTTYTYQVTAFNGGGESGPSNAGSAITKTEPAPTGLTSHAIQRGGLDAVFLKWTNNSTDADSYHIERCAGSTCTNFSEIANIGPNATRYFDSFLPHHATFRYRVRTHSPGGYSGYSNIRTQTTL